MLSVRVGTAVGSCAVEAGQLGEDRVREIVGHSVDELLSHPEPTETLARVKVATATSILLISHDFTTVAALADQVHVLDGGRLADAL